MRTESERTADTRAGQLGGGRARTQERPFESDDAPVARPAKTVKISNSNSSVPENIPKPDDFRKNIDKILAQEEEQKRLALQLATIFISVIKDKKLDSAKDPVTRDKEKQSVIDLIDFARLINSDEHQEDNIGTMSLLSTMMRLMIYQRDRLNELEYELHKMSREVSALKNVRSSSPTQ